MRKQTKLQKAKRKKLIFLQIINMGFNQGRTDYLEIRALPEGLGSVGGPMRCPWYLFHRLF
ncbi:unnamed protein product [Staurois parvus]|uniref:Uncharacterized protein n=1 Tax=Staurois parvus TaxID=386267 RepID=A0ABN9ACM0_9NEOB|nr:unnamed protein product [Staurois parvus]